MSRNPSGKAIQVDVNGTAFEQVDRYKYVYLGTQITVDTNSETGIN